MKQNLPYTLMKEINSKEVNETDGKEIKETGLRPNYSKPNYSRPNFPRPNFGRAKRVPSYTSPNSTGDTLLDRSIFKKYKENKDA